MMLMILGLGAVVGAGCWLLLRGAFPARVTLADAVAAVHAPAVHIVTAAGQDETGWASQVGRPAAAMLGRLGLPGPAVRRDLAALGKSVNAHLAEQATAATLGLIRPGAMWAMVTLAGIDIGVVIPLWVSLALAGLGFFTPILSVRAEAGKRRAEFRHALSAYLDLVVISLAGGAGVEQAMTDAADLGQGPAFADLRHTLASARASRTAPWQALSALGERLDIDELAQLAASIGLAGAEGARVRASLTARAQAMRARQLSDAEAQAASATERMALPIVLFFLGFLVFLGYPAVAAVLDGL
jgi:Flp pilus assembly protein TadB